MGAKRFFFFFFFVLMVQTDRGCGEETENEVAMYRLELFNLDQVAIGEDCGSLSEDALL